MNDTFARIAKKMCCYCLGNLVLHYRLHSAKLVSKLFALYFQVHVAGKTGRGTQKGRRRGPHIRIEYDMICSQGLQHRCVVIVWVVWCCSISAAFSKVGVQAICFCTFKCMNVAGKTRRGTQKGRRRGPHIP